MTQPPRSAPPLRVLYVEDNRVCALLFSEALREQARIELRVAEDGQEAQAAVAQWTPDVLVLDAHLPDGSGLDLLQALRRRPELGQTPAYICSADAAGEDIRQAMAAGCAGYWTKPVSAEALRSSLLAIDAARA